MSFKNSPKSHNKISEIVLIYSSLMTHTEASLQLHCSEDQSDSLMYLRKESNLPLKTQKACLKRFCFFSHAPAVCCGFVISAPFCCLVFLLVVSRSGKPWCSNSAFKKGVVLFQNSFFKVALYFCTGSKHHKHATS